jgi:hypothetical protein
MYWLETPKEIVISYSHLKVHKKTLPIYNESAMEGF